jgi:hypothetical protein
MIPQLGRAAPRWVVSLAVGQGGRQMLNPMRRMGEWVQFVDMGVGSHF